MLHRLKGQHFLHRLFHASVRLLTDSKKNTEIKASLGILKTAVFIYLTNIFLMLNSKARHLSPYARTDAFLLTHFQWRRRNTAYYASRSSFSTVFDGWSMMIYGGTQLSTFRNKLLQNGRNINQQTDATLHKIQVFINKDTRTSNVAAEDLCSVQLEETRTKCRATKTVWHISIRWLHRHRIPSLTSHRIN